MLPEMGAITHQIWVVYFCLTNGNNRPPTGWVVADPEQIFCDFNTLWWTYKKQWKDPPFLMGKSTISMIIFNCYVSSPEGRSIYKPANKVICCRMLLLLARMRNSLLVRSAIVILFHESIWSVWKMKWAVFKNTVGVSFIYIGDYGSIMEVQWRCNGDITGI